MTRRVRVRLVLVLCLVAGLSALATGSATAIPGDPPITLVGPPDGGVVQANPEAITVQYGCPPYRDEGPDFPSPGGSLDYGVVFSRVGPGVDADGRLNQDIRYDSPSLEEFGTGLCSGTYRRTLFEVLDLPPSSIPGQVWWQAYRYCLRGCATRYEVAPVQSFVIRTQASLAVGGQFKKLYDGFGFDLGVRTTGIPDEIPVRIERRAKTGWQVLTTTYVSDGVASVPLALPAGRQVLRAASTFGDQEFASAPVKLLVRKAKDWVTDKRDDGLYQATFGGGDARFRISKKGRVFSGFEGALSAVCSVPNLPAIARLPVELKKARIAPDGSIFQTRVVPGDVFSEIYSIRAKLRNRRVVVRVLSLEYPGVCAGDVSFVARHR
jgi:hypothetical protein